MQRATPLETGSRHSAGARWRVRGRCLCGLAAPLLLGGCLSLAPPYQRPPAPIPPTLADGSAANTPDDAVDTQAAAQVEWRLFFGDPRLRGLLELALADNRDLRRALSRVAEARALYGITHADRLPTIAALASETRSRTPADLSVTGRTTTSSTLQVGFSIASWELDLWGRLRDLDAAGLETWLASVDTAHAVEVALVAQVANSYLVERELDERLVVARGTLATREEASRIMQRRQQVGAASRFEATQSDTLLDQARAELAVLERMRERAHNALELLVGQPLPQENHPLAAVEADFTAGIAHAIPSEVLLLRPDVRATEHRLRAAHAHIGAARAAFLPRITLNAGGGSASSALDGLFAAGSGAWTFAPTLVAPLFDYGRNRANLDLAEARRETAVADYELALQTAFREVADAFAERRWLTQQRDVQVTATATQRERARLAHLRYDNGAASYLEVLDAERERFVAEQALVQTRRSLLASMVSLYAALGGGTTP